MVIFLVYPNPSPISLTQHPVILTGHGRGEGNHLIR